MVRGSGAHFMSLSDLSLGKLFRLTFLVSISDSENLDHRKQETYPHDEAAPYALLT